MPMHTIEKNLQTNQRIQLEIIDEYGNRGKLPADLSLVICCIVG